MDRLKACYELRARGFKPGTSFSHLGRLMEIVSYPFPSDRGGISILIRQAANPVSVHEVRIPESEYVRKPAVASVQTSDT
jgi:hypothetical protein